MQTELDARLDALEQRLGTEFKDRMLLLQAITHRSYLNENPGHPVGHNERLEFLGDAVLEMIVTEFLYKRFPGEPEGVLTNWRGALVNKESCAKAVEGWRLQDFLFMSKGQHTDNAKNPKTLKVMLANAFEAILGSVFLDRGMPASTLLVDSVLLHKTTSIVNSYREFKSEFQELTEKRWKIAPTYSDLAESGPDHDRTFRIGVMLREHCVAEGSGKSKRTAQNAAAEAAMKTISSWESLFSEREQSHSDKGRSGKTAR